MRDIFILYWRVIEVLAVGWVIDLIVDYVKYGRSEEENQNGEEKKVQNDPGRDFDS